MYDSTTNPPGLVTRSISRPIRHGSRTCSATLEDKQTSTLSSANGSARPDARTKRARLGRGRGPGVHLGGVGLDADVVQPGVGERGGEVAGSAADVEQRRARSGRLATRQGGDQATVSSASAP